MIYLRAGWWAPPKSQKTKTSTLVSQSESKELKSKVPSSMSFHLVCHQQVPSLLGWGFLFQTLSSGKSLTKECPATWISIDSSWQARLAITGFYETTSHSEPFSCMLLPPGGLRRDKSSHCLTYSIGNRQRRSHLLCSPNTQSTKLKSKG